MIQKMNKFALDKIRSISGDSLLTVYAPLEAGMKGHKFNLAQLHNLRSELKKVVTSKQHEQIALEIESILQKIDHANEALGIAMFFDGTSADTYTLPFTPEKLTEVSGVYDYWQIEDYYSQDKPYYALTISKNGSNLYRGDMDKLELVEAAGLGKSVKATLDIDELNTNNQQSHPSAPGGEKSSGSHGHGGYKDIEKTLFNEYLRAIDKIVIDSISDKKTPLVLVSVNYEQSAYKNISKYPSISAEGVSTNPDHLSAEELHRKTFPLTALNT